MTRTLWGNHRNGWMYLGSSSYVQDLLKASKLQPLEMPLEALAGYKMKIVTRELMACVSSFLTLKAIRLHTHKLDSQLQVEFSSSCPDPSVHCALHLSPEQPLNLEGEKFKRALFRWV